MRKTTSCLVCLCVLCILGCARSASLSSDLNTIFSAPTLQHSLVGCMVVDVHTHKILYERNADVRMVPASNRKLFTSAAALELLGPKYVLTTSVLADCSPDNSGTISGNLYLKGGGDGLLSVADLDAFSGRLAHLGVKLITGDIVGDSTLFTDGPYPEGWGVDYLSDDYAAQIEALEVNQGVVTVTTSPAATVGDRAMNALDPDTQYIPVVDTATTVGADGTTSILVHRPYDQNLLQVSGTIRVGDTPQKIDITVNNPPLYAATIFRDRLALAGIKVVGAPERGVAPSSAVLLTQHDSVPMAEYIRLMNKPSNNLQAESLVRLIGAAKGKGGDFRSGDLVELSFFRRAGIDPSELDFADGSGVTRLDMVTPHAILKLLAWMAKSPDFNSYFDSLPIAGVDGTLRHRMRNTAAAGKVHAKTGTVRYEHNLSGYVTDASGHLLIFSIMNNNYATTDAEINKVQDAAAARLAIQK